MKITKEIWGNGPDGKEIILYTIQNGSGAFVRLSSVGAGIVSIAVPDKDGFVIQIGLVNGIAQDKYKSGWTDLRYLPVVNMGW